MPFILPFYRLSVSQNRPFAVRIPLQTHEGNLASTDSVSVRAYRFPGKRSNGKGAYKRFRVLQCSFWHVHVASGKVNGQPPGIALLCDFSLAAWSPVSWGPRTLPIPAVASYMLPSKTWAALYQPQECQERNSLLGARCWDGSANWNTIHTLLWGRGAARGGDFESSPTL